MTRLASPSKRPQTPPPSALLQRKCSCNDGGSCGGGCGGKKKSEVQRVAAGNTHEHGAPPIVHDVLRANGQPLDSATRAYMEPRFGHDFSHVRVHADDRAARSADAVSALAYTVGHDIVFAAGQYAPRSSSGMRVLAHELTHVVQQSGAAPSLDTLAIGPAADAYEHEADAQAARVVAGGSASVSMRSGMTHRNLQRQVAQQPAQTPNQSPLQQAGPCPITLFSQTFSRGNDDPGECQYQTASIQPSLAVDPCSCSPNSTNMPVIFNYLTILDGKSYANLAGRLETQASAIGAGLSVTAAGGGTARLVHATAGRAGDPDDTLTASVIAGSLPCSGGSTNGTVTVGGYQTITWQLTASSASLSSASITLTENLPQNQGRIATPTVNVTAGAPAYPAFPGTPRGPNCTCHPVLGVHLGANCAYRGGGAGFGGGGR